jgi:hypothetical protein
VRTRNAASSELAPEPGREGELAPGIEDEQLGHEGEGSAEAPERRRAPLGRRDPPGERLAQLRHPPLEADPRVLEPGLEELFELHAGGSPLVMDDPPGEERHGQGGRGHEEDEGEEGRAGRALPAEGSFGRHQ